MCYMLRGVHIVGLRGSKLTPTLRPDADNAAVGSHTAIFYRRYLTDISCFLCRHLSAVYNFRRYQYAWNYAGKCQKKLSSDT